MPWTADDIPPQAGRTILITGANSGIGYEAARELVAKGAHVVLACRDQAKGRWALESITAAQPSASVELMELDLADLGSIRRFAAAARAASPALHVLCNNAGVMAIPHRTTGDGFEMQFGTNHLGHFALTGLLLERLLATPGARVVTVSSGAHKFGVMHWNDLQGERSYGSWRAYGQSKLANLLFTYELQRRLAPRGTTIAVAAHPGGSRTELTRNLPALFERLTPMIEPLFQGADMGALPTLRAATDPGVLGGQYYGPDGFGEQRGYPKVVGPSDKSHDVDVQRRLWAVSEELTGVVYPTGVVFPVG